MTATARRLPETLNMLECSPRRSELGYVPRVWVQRSERKVDPLDVIETAYRLEGSDEEWLSGILERFAPAVDEGRGVVAYLYDAAARPLRVWNFVGQFKPTPKDLIDVITSADDDYVAQSYLVTPFGTASEQPGFDRQVTFARRLGAYGIRDAIAINGVDTSGLGAWIGALLPEKTIVTDAERERWSKVSAHIVAAMRLRKRLASERAAASRKDGPSREGAATNVLGAGLNGHGPEPDAILSANGKMEHVTEEVAVERSSLADAVRRLDRARGTLRKKDPDEAVDAWKVLVRARWTLVDQFESDGRRYVLAYRNAPTSHGPLAFTVREREIVALAMLGHSPKLIAYELGLAPSTVRVHLTNASRKLGVRTLKGLVSKYRAWLLEEQETPLPNE